MKIDESPHPADILTKPLQGKEFVYKRAWIPGLKGAAPPLPKCQPKEAASPSGATQEPAATRVGLAARRQSPTTPAGASTAARYEHQAFGSAPWRGGEVAGRADRYERGTWGHALSQACLTA